MRALRNIAAALVVVALMCPAAYARHGRGGGTPPTNPLSLPLLTTAQASSMFTFLGSFNAPTSFALGGAAPSIDGSTMYMVGAFYNPIGNTSNVPGLGSFTLPALSGTPDYTGGNGTVSLNIVAPTRPGSYYPLTPYTATAAPATGATSVTLTSVPPGIAGNDGWFIEFQGSDTEKYEITAVSGDTVSWATALAGNSFSTTVTINQWLPDYPYGNASGDALTGSMVANGNLYIAGGTHYDGNCNSNLGWVVQAPPSTPGTSWGAVNTVAGEVTEYSRLLAGTIQPTPSIWAPYFGNDIDTQFPSLAVISCYQPIGWSLFGFDSTNITAAGAAVPVTQFLNYTDARRLDSSYPQQLASRSLSGPFPDENGYTGPYYPATLAAAPAAGATSATFVLPSASVTMQASFTKGQNALSVTSVTGALSNSGIEYSVSGTGIPATSYTEPSFDYAPGTNLTTCSTTTPCTFNLDQPTAATESGVTLTLTPVGYKSGWWTVFFSDGESRIVHLMGGDADPQSTAIPATYSPYDPTQFVSQVPQPYDLDAAPISGQTSGTFAALPAGIAANGQWFVTFTGTSAGNSGLYETDTVTAVSGDTLTWSPALPTGTYVALTSIYEDAPLTCSGGCTTAVTVAPMGDNWVATYGGGYGGGFIVPNTRTLALVSANYYGVARGKGPYNVCDGGASSSDSIPLAPDTAPYSRLEIQLYDLGEIYDYEQAGLPQQAISPYAMVEFPDDANIKNSVGCIGKSTGATGFASFDQNSNTLFLSPSNSAGGAANGVPTVFEYAVAAP